MDVKQLAEELGLEKNEYLELIELFIEKGMTDLNELQSALGAGDAENAASVAHSIKGAAGNLGFMALYEEAKKIEAQALLGSLDGAVESIQTLRKDLEEVTALIR